MIKLKLYRSIDKIPVDIWDKLASKDRVNLESNHLKAIEYSGVNNIKPYYYIGFIGDNPIGIAYFFFIDINLARMANSYPKEVLDTVQTWNPGFMDVCILEVGHIASLGSTIEVSSGYEKKFLKLLSNEIDKVGKENNADFVLIRDIPSENKENYNSLLEEGYYSVMGFPIARIPLRWESFDSYLSSLKSKKRNNLKNKIKKMDSPEISVEIIEDYSPYADRLAELWTNVAKSNNGYEHEQLTPEYFRSMSEQLKDRSHVVAIKCKGTLVAYGLNLIGDEEYFGVAEGLDYSLRDKYELYTNNMLEGLKVACSLKKKFYNIGVTTYDFKTSLGAELEPAFYYLKAFKNDKYSEVYANLIEDSIEQPDNDHRVFNDVNIENRIQLKEYKENSISKTDNSDIFSKHIHYTRVDAARAAGFYNYYPQFESAQDAVIKENNRDVIMLGTNSYLGLSTHEKVKKAMIEAIEKYGSGCSGSPLLNGTLDIHNKLSRKLAKFIGKERSLLYSTGYQTNLGVIPAIAGRNDVLIMDKRNHASLIDGAMLSGAKLVRYKHNDLSSLEKQLKRYKDLPKLVVTDSIFSMEGTVINLPKIVNLTKKYNARLMLDESHAIGVYGKQGAGVADYYNLTHEVDIIMGTFSKSFASIGGFITGDEKIIDTIQHTSRSHIFSASLPPSAIAAIDAALDIIISEPERREALFQNSIYLANGLKELGFNIDYSDSSIIPLHCGNELLALSAYKKLFDDGVFVNPVTYPAVPKGQEILRISLMATHTESMLKKTLEAFKKLRTKNWPIKGEYNGDK